MFIGHYSVSFAIKAHERSIPLWVLFIAVQFLDVFWGIFILTGVEKARIVPGITATNPLDLYYMPYTHSLVGALFWSAVGFALYWFFRGREGSAALLVGVAVFSHWLLDLVVHRPDLALYDDTYKMGLGLWDYPATAFALEIALLFGGIFLYLRSTTATDAIGKYGIPILALLMIVAQSVVFFGSPPTSAGATAVTALVAYFVFAAVTLIVERRRH